MGLDVGRLGAEQRLGALNGERLHLIDELAAPIVASAGIALCVLVGEDGALRLEDRLAHHVLGGNQLEVVLLPLGLSTDRRVNRRVGAGQRGERGGTGIGHPIRSAQRATLAAHPELTLDRRDLVHRALTSAIFSSTPPWSAPVTIMGSRGPSSGRALAPRAGLRFPPPPSARPRAPPVGL